MNNLNSIMDAVGIPVFNVDETGVHAGNNTAKASMSANYSQEIERFVAVKSDDIAVIFEQAGEVQPYRVELNENGQGHYFTDLEDARAFAKTHTAN